MIYPFPKIWQLGTRNVATIFDSEVEITEKIDGSQFNFGIKNCELFIRSRGANIVINCPEKMFKTAVDYIVGVKDKLVGGFVYHCEYLNKPKHNTIAYDRVPLNNLICFGISSPDGIFTNNFYDMGVDDLGIEVVPTLFRGLVTSMKQIEELLETESILGGSKVEGIVIKNYNQQVLVGGMHQPIMCAKYVSVAFKEKHNVNWKKEKTVGGRMETLLQSYRTTARWEKAIQHLKEEGRLTETPQDIGALMKEVHRDIDEECKEEIKDMLWKEYSKRIKRVSTAGLAIWYKKQIAIEHFPTEEKND